jgi:hypothetical protein
MFSAENTALLELVAYELGGRRCEIVGLQKNPELNGKIGVTTQHLPNKERYVFQFFDVPNSKPVQVRPANLKRRDYTMDDA